MSSLLADLRYALRHLRHAPGFAAAAILTLAFGIGANTAMLTMMNALTLRQLPVKDPNGLVAVRGINANAQPRMTLIPAVAELQREGPLQDVCAYNGGGVFPLESNGVTAQGVIAFVTGQCFKAFGVSPILGRVIEDADAPLMTAGSRVAVIGHAFWMRVFNGDPSVIGKLLKGEGRELTVIGVMPEGFVGLHMDHGIDVFMPFDSFLPARKDRRPGATHILGRLKPGVTFDAARAELETRWSAVIETATPATLSAAERDDFRNLRAQVQRIATGVSYYRDRYAQSVTIVFGLTVALLLLACVNLGGLLLARLSARSGEVSVRLALGGSPWRIGRQMVIESLVLSLTGAALGIPVSFALTTPLASFLPVGIVDRTMAFTPDRFVLTATAVLGVAAGVLMSALPTWLALGRFSRFSGFSRFMWDRTIVGATNRWARGLLVAQVALSVVMTIGAALLARSLYLLEQTPLGLRTEGVLTVRAMPVPNGYQGIDNQSYYPVLLDKIAALPGVRSAAFGRILPLYTADAASSWRAKLVGVANDVPAVFENISPGYFETLGVPLLAGRTITWADNTTTRRVVMVNERLARMLAPNGDILERRIAYGVDAREQDMVVVGVVGNHTMGNPRYTDLPVIYIPAMQLSFAGLYPMFEIAVEGDPTGVANGVRQILKDSGREFVQSARPLKGILADAPASERMGATVAVVVAGLAIVLALIGIHGSLAYAISRRRREIGVRVAVGAAPGAVARMVVGEGVMVTLAGVAIGLPAAFFAARSLATLTFGISIADPLSFAAVAILFVTIGVAAGVAPARRASGVDPVVALRAE